MPFHFKSESDLTELNKGQSVLIVPCRFCPAASAAVKEKKPYIELFRTFLKTDSYAKQIENLKSRLKARGIKPEIFETRWIHQFVLCMWSMKRRGALDKRARNVDAVIVLGCEAAVQTVKDSIKSSSCKILQGLETEGVMSIKPKLGFPANLTLELESVTPMTCQETQPAGTLSSIHL